MSRRDRQHPWPRGWLQAAPSYSGRGVLHVVAMQQAGTGVRGLLGSLAALVVLVALVAAGVVSLHQQ